MYVPIKTSTTLRRFCNFYNLLMTFLTLTDIAFIRNLPLSNHIIKCLPYHQHFYCLAILQDGATWKYFFPAFENILDKILHKHRLKVVLLLKKIWIVVKAILFALFMIFIGRAFTVAPSHVLILYNLESCKYFRIDIWNSKHIQLTVKNYKMPLFCNNFLNQHLVPFALMQQGFFAFKHSLAWL